MKLYIASHSRETAAQLRKNLIAAGHEVTSRWITNDTKFHMGPDAYSGPEKSQIAVMDEEDVRSATDGVVVVAEPEGRYVPGGKHVEAGIALGLGRPLYVIGRRENIFHWHPRTRVFTAESELLTYLAQAQEAASRQEQH